MQFSKHEALPVFGRIKVELRQAGADEKFVPLAAELAVDLFIIHQKIRRDAATRDDYADFLRKGPQLSKILCAAGVNFHEPNCMAVDIVKSAMQFALDHLKQMEIPQMECDSWPRALDDLYWTKPERMASC